MRAFRLFFVTLLVVTAIAGCSSGCPQTLSPPSVTSTVPAPDDTNVPTNRKLAATFNMDMDRSSLNENSFVLKQGSVAVAGKVAFVDQAVTFKANSNLAADTQYTATITTEVKNAWGIALVANKVWRFTTGSSEDKTAPTVILTIPLTDAVGVPSNAKIAVTFSEPIDPETVNDKTFTLVSTQGGAAVAGVVTWVNRVVTFTPKANLSAGVNYTAKITTNATDLAGNKLAADKVWSFRVAVNGGGGNGGGGGGDTTRPTVLSTVPDTGAAGVSISSSVAATFSEDMDPATIVLAGNFIVTGPGPGFAPVPGSIAYDAPSRVATFTPDSDFDASTTFTATIKTGAEDLAGNGLAVDKVWTFTTGVAPDTTVPTVLSTNPDDLDESVAINKKITATFSESMDASTITPPGTFVLATEPGAVPVTGVVTYDLVTSVATFTPDANLAVSTTYRATITTTAEDLAGNPLAVKTWVFTTGTSEAQTVSQLPAPPLGDAAPFAILSSASITNIPTSVITGDVGLSPDTGDNIIGFSEPLTCPEVTLQGGNIYKVDAGGPICALVDPDRISDAKTAANAAFINANVPGRNGATPGALLPEMGGLTLYPGLYESLTTLELHGDLYLDAQGDPDAVFVIRSSTSLTTFSDSEVHLTKGAKATNVYWTAGSAVTLGTNSIMKGTIIAGTAITLQTLADLEGRALNQGPAAAAITCDSCTITVPSP